MRLFNCFSYVSFMVLLAVAAGAVASIDDRSWTIQDSIAVRYFTRTPNSPPGIFDVIQGDQSIVRSPDGKYFFFIFFYGDLKSDSLVSELQVFSVKQLLTTLMSGSTKAEPVARAVFFSSIKSADPYTTAGISFPFWESETSIVFTGMQGNGPHRIYRLNTVNGELQPLTSEHDKVSIALGAGPSSAYVVREDAVIFMSYDLDPWTPLDKYPMSTIRDGELWQMMWPHRFVGRLYVRRGGQERSAKLVDVVQDGLYGAQISPDLKWAVMVYAKKGVSTFDKRREDKAKLEVDRQFVLVNMQTGASRAMLEAPVGPFPRSGESRIAWQFDAFWSVDSRRVLLVNTMLPGNDYQRDRPQKAYIVDYSLSDGRWAVLEPMEDSRRRKVFSVEWIQEGKALSVTRGDSNGSSAQTVTVYTYDGGRWVGRSGSPSPLRELKGPFPEGFTVQLRESMNDPPAMWVTYGDREVLITEPDPALKGVWRAPVESVKWTMQGGHVLKGLLMLPRGFSRGKDKPLPLVIQASALVNENAFLPDGQASTGFAAQPLVAEGYAVLQLEFSPGVSQEFHDPTRNTPREAPLRVNMLDEAVGRLAAEGIIDPTKVGLVGFSRTGYHTHYIVTHPGQTKLAAAAIFDAMTASYGEYVIDAALGQASAVAGDEDLYGEGIFWHNKKGWLDAPLFNVEKVTTPVLFSVNGHKMNLTIPLETVGAYLYCRRPFEYLYFHDGGHQLQRPRQREAAMQATIDWMNFWILGRRPTSPERADRWIKIKTNWDKVQQEEAIRIHK